MQRSMSHGQWWSILSTHVPHWLQWWQRSGLGALHLLHQRRFPVDRLTVMHAGTSSIRRGARDDRVTTTTKHQSVKPTSARATHRRHSSSLDSSSHVGTMTSTQRAAVVPATSALTSTAEAAPCQTVIGEEAATAM